MHFVSQLQTLNVELMLVNYGIPTSSEPGQSSQPGAELLSINPPSYAPPCSFVANMYTTNVEHTSLLLQNYIVILCLATFLHAEAQKDRQIAERYKLSWQKVMLESLCNTGCICSGVVRGDNNAKKVTHYSPFNCML